MIPTNLSLHQKSRTLEIRFKDHPPFELPCEYLRVYSPSAEVRGHGDAPKKWPAGKKDVNIIGIDPIGNYAVKLVFDDGHDSGLYTWEYLFELGTQFESHWQAYLAALESNGLTR